MSIWAKPGAKVVCVDNAHTRGQQPVLEIGAVYEIAKVMSTRGIPRTGPYKTDKIAVTLAGIRNPYAPNTGAFALSRFRPLITRTQEQDLEHFLPLLKGAPVEESA